ncbi:hypothetical protein G6011_05147 [Alternaria panax]|uniref:Aminoglycoside phosphotransferase domain-containing protein n=1 Tax=Alternaria panax TaxID=48097 RepID=A0AAD4FE13_9PLEO|nr:hypothetical protein G6011_05147 [Alternaria panax]
MEERKERPAFIVQLRPALHALDLHVIRAASITYPTLAPTVKPLVLALPGCIFAYEMEKLDGTPLSRLQQRGRSLDSSARGRLKHLVTSFADFIAQSCHSPHQVLFTSRATRADSPMNEGPSLLSQCRGKVGSTIIPRLERLASELPDAHLRRRAIEALRAVQRTQDYPVILNHGDLIPSNILVDEDTWKITGLVDWSEAEYLPVGTCLYGLEYLLGYLSPADSEIAPIWTYFDDAAQLRQLFWTRLIDATPELGARMEDVKVMRDVGVLLWHGIAWDDGAINRVVNEQDDVEDLTKLHAFLAAD